MLSAVGVRPGAGVLALLIALSFWFILTGVADIARAIDVREHRIISALLGVVSIAAGVIIVADPVSAWPRWRCSPGSASSSAAPSS